MAIQRSGGLVRRHVAEIVNAQHLDVVDEIYQSDLTFNDPLAPGGAARGHDGLKAFLSGIYTAIPDFHFTLNAVLEDGDRAAWHGTVSGTLQREFAGIPATGQHFEAPICEVFQVQDGKISEVWVYTDPLSILQQLGAIPTPGSTGV